MVEYWYYYKKALHLPLNYRSNFYFVCSILTKRKGYEYSYYDIGWNIVGYYNRKIKITTRKEVREIIEKLKLGEKIKYEDG